MVRDGHVDGHVVIAKWLYSTSAPKHKIMG